MNKHNLSRLRPSFTSAKCKIPVLSRDILRWRLFSFLHKKITYTVLPQEVLHEPRRVHGMRGRLPERACLLQPILPHPLLPNQPLPPHPLLPNHPLRHTPQTAAGHRKQWRQSRASREHWYFLMEKYMWAHKITNAPGTGPFIIVPDSEVLGGDPDLNLY